MVIYMCVCVCIYIYIYIVLKIAIKSTWWWLLCSKNILPWLVLLELFAINLVILGVVDEKEIVCHPQMQGRDKTVTEMTDLLLFSLSLFFSLSL